MNIQDKSLQDKTAKPMADADAQLSLHGKTSAMKIRSGTVGLM